MTQFHFSIQQNPKDNNHALKGDVEEGDKPSLTFPKHELSTWACFITCVTMGRYVPLSYIKFMRQHPLTMVFSHLIILSFPQTQNRTLKSPNPQD